MTVGLLLEGCENRLANSTAVQFRRHQGDEKGEFAAVGANLTRSIQGR